jgi:hypothetical protein
MKNLKSTALKRPVWFGVVASKASLDRILNDSNVWWCLPDEVAIGDTVIMYCAHNASRKKQGVFGIFSVDFIDLENQSDCSSFGSFVGKKLIKVFLIRENIFDISLKLADMKRDSILANAQFIRRNCQGTYFEINETLSERIKYLLKSSNQAEN